MDRHIYFKDHTIVESLKEIAKNTGRIANLLQQEGAPSEGIEIIPLLGDTENPKPPSKFIQDEFGPVICRYMIPFPETFGVLVFRRNPGPPVPGGFTLLIQDSTTQELIEYVRKDRTPTEGSANEQNRNS
jgi:hypothetical protein